MFKIYQFLLLLVLQGHVYSQSHVTNTLQANQLYTTGDSLLRDAKFEQCIEPFKKAAKAYQNSGQWSRYLKSLNKISEAYLGEQQNDKAIGNSELVLNEAKTRPSDSNLAKAEALRTLGVAYANKGAIDQALDHYQKSLDLYKTEQGEEHAKVADVYNSLGLIYINKGSYLEAEDYFEKAIAINKKASGQPDLSLAKSYNNLAIVYIQTSEFDLALDYSLKALKIRQALLRKDHPDIATSLHNIGICSDASGHYEQALRYHQQAREIWIANFGNAYPNVAISYHNSGMAYDGLGFYDLSLEYHQKGLAIWTRKYGKDHPSLAYSYTYIGTGYSKKKAFEQGLENYKKALAIWKKSVGEKHPFVAMLLNNIGDVYKDQHKYNLAMTYYQKALAIRRENFGEQHQDVSYSYRSIAAVYSSQNNQKEALKYLNKALDIRLAGLGPKHPRIAELYNDIGVIYYKSGSHSKGIPAFRSALGANLRGADNPSIRAETVNQDALSRTEILRSLKYKALSFESLYQNSKKIGELKTALGLLQLCDTLLADMQHDYIKFADKLVLRQMAADVYDHAVRVSFNLHQETEHQSYLQLAFHFVEKSKAGILSEAINGLSAKKLGLLPDQLMEQEQRMKVDQSYFKSQLIDLTSQKEGYDTTRFNLYQDRMFRLNRQLDSLHLVFKKDYPRYYQLKYRSNTISIEDLQAALPQNTALLEYFVGDSNAYVFTVTRNSFRASSIQELARVNVNIEIFRNLITLWSKAEDNNNTYQQFIASSNLLYEHLAAQSLEYLTTYEDISNLVVIPDGKLSYLPFEILIRNSVSPIAGDYSSPDYLIKDYNLSYGYSATLNYQTQGSERTQPAPNNYIGYAPEYDAWQGADQLVAFGKFRASVSDLKWNRQEIEASSEYMNGVFRTGAEATESNFKQDLKGYGVLHLAMHALIDDEDPMLSKLVFTRDETDSLNDGYLHTYELFNMQINPELVVLSACNTGYGRLEKGEGMTSLAYAFAYAGCPTTVMSQWQIDDRSTSELMQHFYKGLSEGMSKDEALRNAKLQFIKDPAGKYTNPSYWAGFVLFGNTAPLQSTETHQSLWIISLSIFGAVILAVIFMVRRRKVRSLKLS